MLLISAKTGVEGVRAKSLGHRALFKKGAAHLAIATDTVIVPVIFSESCWHAWPYGSFPRRNLELEFFFLEPISCVGRTADEITQTLAQLKV
jgi:hypothetical protein